MPTPDADIAEALRDTVGDALRVVGFHEGSDWHIEYMREDVREGYADASIDDIADDLVLDVLASPRQESLYELGDLHATVRLFEDGVVVHVPTDDRSGYLVSLDAGGDYTGRDIVGVVRDAADA
ncbi:MULTISPECIES: hypothetical protein [Halobacterium]|uniref:DUF7522 family protein n=1 Tax=Halobacterium TaxID=2239 RepID=UPI00073EA3C2|nr:MULTISPECIES: hypothetical protein [Halobacterium]MCG1002645.1 hypothetical protein [Halobacterium noricense]